MNSMGVDKGLEHNWGRGGYDVYPEDFNNRMMFSARCEFLDKNKSCIVCKEHKTQHEYSRREWVRQSGSGWSGICVTCEHKRPDMFEQCMCSRELEVWSMCNSCCKRIAVASRAAHESAMAISRKVVHPESNK